jgi:hypothetical protein
MKIILSLSGILIILFIVSPPSPTAEAGTAGVECGVYHTAQTGETLYSIAWVYETTAEEIAFQNLGSISNINLVTPGTRLCINPGGSSNTPADPAAISPADLNTEAAGVAQGLISTGVPQNVAVSIEKGFSRLRSDHPECKIDGAMLAAVASNESHGWWDRVKDDGIMRPPLYGVSLDGSGKGGNRTPHINKLSQADKDRFGVTGRYIKAVGPTQFLPSTWINVEKEHGAQLDPQSMIDSTLATGLYLCNRAGIQNDPLASDDSAAKAFRGYNNSGSYVKSAMGHTAKFREAINHARSGS